MQGVKDTLWGFATLKHRPSNAFLLASARHCYERLAQFNSQNVANVTWAYAKLGHHPGLLLDAFATQMVANRQASGPQILNTKIVSGVSFIILRICASQQINALLICWIYFPVPAVCLLDKVYKLLIRHNHSCSSQSSRESSI